MIVFGGTNEKSEKMNDVWIFDMKNSVWAKAPANGYIPPPQRGSGGCVVKGELHVLGPDLTGSKLVFHWWAHQSFLLFFFF